MLARGGPVRSDGNVPAATPKQPQRQLVHTYPPSVAGTVVASVGCGAIGLGAAAFAVVVWTAPSDGPPKALAVVAGLIALTALLAIVRVVQSPAARLPQSLWLELDDAELRVISEVGSNCDVHVRVPRASLSAVWGEEDSEDSRLHYICDGEHHWDDCPRPLQVAEALRTALSLPGKPAPPPVRPEQLLPERGELPSNLRVDEAPGRFRAEWGHALNHVVLEADVGGVRVKTTGRAELVIDADALLGLEVDVERDSVWPLERYKLVAAERRLVWTTLVGGIEGTAFIERLAQGACAALRLPPPQFPWARKP